MQYQGGDGEDTCAAGRYLAREPESLVVSGYRGWLSFAAERDVGTLDAIWNLFNQKLDRSNARFAMSGLERLVRQLGMCATCPLRFHCQGTKHLCRDECLILALVSGLQNGEDEAALQSAMVLTTCERAFDVLAAAGEFAMALKISGKQLLPIHAETVRMIVAGTQKPQIRTLH